MSLRRVKGGRDPDAGGDFNIRRSGQTGTTVDESNTVACNARDISRLIAQRRGLTPVVPGLTRTSIRRSRPDGTDRIEQGVVIMPVMITRFLVDVTNGSCPEPEDHRPADGRPSPDRRRRDD